MVWINNGSDLLDQSSNYETILGVCIALPVLTTIATTLRGYARGRVLRTLGLDDYVIFFSALCAIIYAGLCIGQSKWGLGLPIQLRPKANLNPYSIINFVGRPFYMVGILGFKVALCLAYLRILRTSQNKTYRGIVWGVLIACTLGHIVGTLILIFQCSPVRKSWLPLTPGVCLPNDATFYGLAAVTIAFDVIIFFLPIPLLLNLNIDASRKLVLCGVFLLGLLTTVCSILRMIQVSAIAKTGNSTMLVLWGVIELNVGIILTCIPTLGPLLPYFRAPSAYQGGSRSTKNAYQLSSVEQKSSGASNVMRSSRPHTVLAAGLATPTAKYDKYGDYRQDMVAGSGSESTTGEIDNDQVRLKGAMHLGGNIVKTTDIRVSDEREIRGGLEEEKGVGLRTW